MNSPQRGLAQRHYVGPLFERLGGRVTGGRVLEVGCGRGVGVEVIFERFGAAVVQALDFDPAMVQMARRRLSRYTSDRVSVSVGDATQIDAGADAFDAVFDFGAIHQIANWRKAVSEVRRVLKPGGRFFFEEIAWRPLRSMMRFTVRDYGDLVEDPFSPTKFRAELRSQGFSFDGKWVTRRILSLTGVIGDIIGVATKASLAASQD